MHAASGKHAGGVKRGKKYLVREHNHVTAAKRGKICKCCEMREANVVAATESKITFCWLAAWLGGNIIECSVNIETR